MRVDFFVTPLDIGSGTALPATITYKRQVGASETQVSETWPLQPHVSFRTQSSSML